MVLLANMQVLKERVRSTKQHPTMNKPYHLEATPSRVDFYSTERLPLEPYGTMQVAREELRHALKLLSPNAGHGLAASLTTPHQRCFDVENILFYNVGPARFKTSSFEGLTFRLNRAHLERHPSFNYHHRYEILPLTPMAIEPHFSFELDRLNTTVKPHHVWWRACQVARANVPHIVGDFRLKIEITGPVQSPGLTVIAKPLVDGIVSALHFMPGEPDTLAVSLVATSLGISSQSVAQALCDVRGKALGPRKKLLRRAPKFVAWDPADGGCVDCSIRWESSSSTKVRVAVRIEPAL